jgi:osmotically-inducible protein OsmY
MIMTMLKRVSGFFLAALLALAIGCASTSSSKPGTAGAYVDDAWITTKVKAEIFKEPSLKVTDINVETRNNVVQLSGFVDSAATMSKAVSIARSVEGVSSVKNDMRLK